MNTMNRIAAGCLICVAAICANAVNASAWWFDGHENMTAAALQDLQADTSLYQFLTANKSKILSGNEPPGAHYIDIDTTATTTGNAGTVSYGTDFNNFRAGTFQFPTTTAAAQARYGARYISQNGNGGVPWLANDALTTLTNKMKAAGTDPNAWNSLLSQAGVVAHYLGDMHNPMHLATNYDGESTGQGGLHARYEGYMLENGSAVRYPTLVANITTATPIYYGPIGDPTFVNDLFSRIVVDYAKNADILAADLTAKAMAGGSTSSVAYDNAMWSLLQTDTQDSFQDGSLVIASAFHTAWVNAGSPVIPGTTPEPATLSLLAIGGIMAAIRRKRQA